MGKPNQPLLLTVKEVSTLLRIHRPKVYDLVRDGTLQGFKVGSDWRIRRDSVERLIGEIPVDFFDRKRLDGGGDDSDDGDEKAPNLRVA